MNFSLVLMILTVLTGVIWALDRFVWRPQRLKKAKEESDKFAELNRQAIDQGEISVIGEARSVYDRIAAQPKWIEYTGGFFPVILFVFILRSFLAEPFRIPSGSMLPTLHSGDFILVNKYEYGMRFPVFNFAITEGTAPKRGDVVVFKYPLDKNVDFIKRVVGVPGDEIRYFDKKLYVNGVLQETTEDGTFFDKETYTDLKQFNENLDGVEHKILENDKVPSMARPVQGHNGLNQCLYNMGDVVCKVPEGQYFMMGDNRDNSADSRFWGFVPREDIVGRAFFIWLNLSDMGRIGSIR